MYASNDMTAMGFTAIACVIAVSSVVRIWTNITAKKSKIAWATVLPKQYKNPSKIIQYCIIPLG